MDFATETTSELAPKCSRAAVPQQVAAVFSIDVSFWQARRLLPALPQKRAVLSAPVFDLVASRQCSGWAYLFLPLGPSVSALLPEPASARVQVQCLALEPSPTIWEAGSAFFFFGL